MECGATAPLWTHGGGTTATAKAPLTRRTPQGALLLPFPLAPQEGQRGRGETGGQVPEDGAVSAVGNDPEVGSRDGSVQLQRNLHRIERIAIAMHDQGP